MYNTTSGRTKWTMKERLNRGITVLILMHFGEPRCKNIFDF